MKIEYINKAVLPVTVLVIGAGGNGSQMITQLGRIDYALRKFGKPGLHVTLMDDDTVSESNIGRQLFAESEIGAYKANILISRINRFYSLQWEAVTEKFTAAIAGKMKSPNVIISCTDNVHSRVTVHKYVKEVSKKKKQTSHHEWQFHYWIDMGNTKTRGQIFCGSPRYKLPTFVDENPDAAKMEAVDDTPSCSLAEALAKQDLFVNTFLSNLAAKLFYEMLMAEESINYRGVYMNLDNLNIQKIKDAA